MSQSLYPMDLRPILYNQPTPARYSELLELSYRSSSVFYLSASWLSRDTESIQNVHGKSGQWTPPSRALLNLSHISSTWQYLYFFPIIYLMMLVFGTLSQMFWITPSECFSAVEFYEQYKMGSWLVDANNSALETTTISLSTTNKG